MIELLTPTTSIGSRKLFRKSGNQGGALVCLQEGVVRVGLGGSLALNHGVYATHLTGILY